MSTSTLPCFQRALFDELQRFGAAIEIKKLTVRERSAAAALQRRGFIRIESAAVRALQTDELDDDRRDALRIVRHARSGARGYDFRLTRRSTGHHRRPRRDRWSRRDCVRSPGVPRVTLTVRVSPAAKQQLIKIGPTRVRAFLDDVARRGHDDVATELDRGINCHGRRHADVATYGVLVLPDTAAAVKGRGVSQRTAELLERFAARCADS